MTLAQSRITTQGQISVPAAVRKRLGIGPGSVLEWSVRNGEVSVRKASRYSSTEIHAALFDDAKPPRGVDVKQAIRQRIRQRHARD
ncbi:MAG: AbrB/MazE/SpoVT family DNA-binding domain-containing protein [Proteobacteria bacterium]|nr:AbrB/MazE/SpoVT family DNA-binding domain-containing protein [Pseudomonadota bacterium]